MNTVGYFEIQADNPQKTIDFYSNIFGWKFMRDKALPEEYWQIQYAGTNGGLLKHRKKVPESNLGTNFYTCSIEVKDFDRTAKNILKNGGQVILEKFAVPKRCWQGYFLDNQGNNFGIFQVDETAG